MELSLLAKITALVKRRLQVERRAAKRLAPGQRTVCLIRPKEDATPLTGLVQNLSVKGIGLLLDGEPPPGTVLRLLLVNGSHTFAVAVEMKVVRSCHIAGSQWFLAGPFVQPLRYEELVPFMM